MSLTDRPHAQLSGPERELPDATVLDLFERHVAERPDAVALVSGDEELTYGDLDRMAADLAAKPGLKGITPHAVVAVGTTRSFALVAGMLAVWKAGGVYLPLDPGHPADRISFLLDDAGAAAMIADGVVSTVETTDGSQPRSALVARDRPAYIIYTSGSTGFPKGVEVGHRALLNVVLDLAREMDSGPTDRWTTMAPAAFDISMAEFCVPLATGGCLVLTSESDLRDAGALVRLVKERGITRMQAVPSQWRMLLDAGFDGAEIVAMVGGEALTASLAVRLRGRLRRLLNGYGPTETAVVSTVWHVPEDVAEADGIPIGAPIANTRISVVDEQGGLVGPGEVGELLIAGAGVAAGYLNRPELTAEKFVQDPYDTTGERFYRTGDRCRIRPDGLLEYLGRGDGQVKIRGQRIELGEVEARLAGHPGLAAVAAAVHEDSLVAYVVVASGETAPEAAEIRAHAGRTLPASMVPNIVVVLDELPLGPSGKVDRSALAVPSSSDVPSAASSVVNRVNRTASLIVTLTPSADGTPLGNELPDGERLVSAVCEICREVLGVADVQPDDDLFDLGAHSLTLMQIAARMEAAWGVEISVDVFYDAERVSDIVVAVADLREVREVHEVREVSG